MKTRRKTGRPKKKYYKRIPKKWNAWLKVIQNETSHQLHLGNVYSKVLGIYEANKKLHDDTVFYEFLRENYAGIASIGVRRITDPDMRSLSLIRLLWEIYDNCHLLTRRRYVRLYDSGNRQRINRIANIHYDKFVGVGRDCLTKAIVRKDISILKSDPRICLIRKYVNKQIAHRNIRPIRKMATYRDLKKSLGVIKYIVTRYSSLLFAQGLIDMTPVIGSNWTAIFERPWVVEGGC